MNINLNNVNFLTHNNVQDFIPQISDQNVVWRGDNEIYLYDHNNASVTQITDNDNYENQIQISGNNVVWWSSDGNDNEIYLFNGSEIIQLTDNDVNDGSPKLSGNNVAWKSQEGFYPYYPGNSGIYLYNGLSTIQLTDSETYISQFGISGDNVVWSENDGKDYEIYLYDGSNINQLTRNGTYDSSPQISGNNIVWAGDDGKDNEIFFYDGTEITQITNNDTDDYNPQISGNNIVWSAYDGNDDEIYFFNGTETIQLTNNATYDSSPQISGNNVVWSAYDGNDDEIYFFNGTETIQVTNNDIGDNDPQISGSNITWTGDYGNESEIYLNYSPNLTPGEINGYKWHDLSENGLFDTDESGIEGWTIYLDDNQNGQLDDGETSTVTDANGFYRFTDLRFGAYTVAEQNEPRWNQTYPVAVEYEWQDSKQPNSITFDWVDISAVGTELDLGDDESASVTLPFSFAFYGEANDTVNISSNGYLTFADQGTEYNNNPITYCYGNFNNFIAPFWDDLNPGHSGIIYHHYDAQSDRFIVQYQDVARYEIEGSLTFQTILNSDGSIVFQYNEMDATVDSATVGLESSDHSRGLQIVYDAEYVEEQLAVEFVPVRSSDTVNSHEVFVDTGETLSNLNFGNSLQTLQEDIRIEAEDYQGYYDQYYDNIGGGYRNDSVDIEPTTDIGGGFNVGWIESGEWLTYSVDIPYADNYQVVGRIASEVDTDHSMSVSINGESTTLNFGGTGDWQSFEDVVGEELLYLNSGTYELRLDMGSSYFNINYLDFIAEQNLDDSIIASSEVF